VVDFKKLLEKKEKQKQIDRERGYSEKTVYLHKCQRCGHEYESGWDFERPILCNEYNNFRKCKGLIVVSKEVRKILIE